MNFIVYLVPLADLWLAWMVISLWCRRCTTVRQQDSTYVCLHVSNDKDSRTLPIREQGAGTMAEVIEGCRSVNESGWLVPFASLRLLSQLLGPCWATAQQFYTAWPSSKLCCPIYWMVKFQVYNEILVLFLFFTLVAQDIFVCRTYNYFRFNWILRDALTTDSR